MVPFMFASGIVGDRETEALTRGSIKLQNARKTTDKLNVRESHMMHGTQQGDGKFDPEESITYAEDDFLTKVFPIFLAGIGIFIVIMSLVMRPESNVPLYLGIFVTVIAAIWSIHLVIKSNNERKKKFLRQRMD